MPAAWIDISMPLATGMRHWPGDPDPIVELGRLAMHPHTGTHMDAPLHFIDGAAPIDSLPFNATVGPAQVIPLEALDTESLEPGSRVLIQGATDDGLPLPVAQRLAGRAPACVGIDSLSIGDEAVHRVILGAGAWVIEGLVLERLEPGLYELICLPLRIAGGDGAPARAIARRIE
jgi:arylformamidase